MKRKVRVAHVGCTGAANIGVLPRAHVHVISTNSVPHSSSSTCIATSLNFNKAGFDGGIAIHYRAAWHPPIGAPILNVSAISSNSVPQNSC